MGEALEIVKTMVQPVTKLVEMVGSAIGIAYEPRHLRKMADAEAYKIKMLSNAIDEASKLPVTYDKGNISMSTADFEDIAKRAEFRAKYQFLIEQNNIDNIVENAYQELVHKPEIQNDPIDIDWATRFFNVAKEISSDEMQHIWGKILAGEIEKPGSFSMRTLDVIRNISQKEAYTFQKIAPFVIQAGDNLFLTSESSICNKYGISFNDLLILDESGLISATEIGMVNISEDAPDLLMYTTERALTLDNAPSFPAKITFGIYSLTRAGRELFHILNCKPNEKYFFDFSEHIFKIGKKYNLSVYEVNNILGTSVEYNESAIRTYHTN